MADPSKEGRLQLAIDAYKRGLYATKKDAAKAFDVPRTTFTARLGGTTYRKEAVANSRKLTDTEETTLSTWILDMEGCGLPPRISTVRYLAQKLLSARLSSSNTVIRESWVNWFVKRHLELRTKYT